MKISGFYMSKSPKTAIDIESKKKRLLRLLE